MDFLKTLLKQPSTYKGLSALAAVGGVALAPEAAEQIGGAALTIYGLIATFIDK